jgi:hypothetical protein
MRDVEALEAEHTLPALGELPAGGRTHAADTDDDDIKSIRQTRSLPPLIRREDRVSAAKRQCGREAR